MSATSGSGRNASNVRRQSNCNITGKIRATAKIVLLAYIKAPPTIIRTAARSLMARDIEIAGASALVKLQRQFLQVRVKIVGQVVLKTACDVWYYASLKEEKNSGDCCDSDECTAIPQQLRSRDTYCQIVNRIAQDNWTKHSAEIRDENATYANDQHGLIRRDVVPQSLT